MDNDDILKGRLLSRREILSLFGLGSAAALFVACTGDDDDDPAATVPQSTAAITATPTSETTGTSTAASSAADVSNTAVATSTILPRCIVLPELTEGPYFIDDKLLRSDIRADSESGEVKEGTLLKLSLNVVAVSGATCAPMEGATVDIWHCDALGEYSGFRDNAQGFNTVGEDWLRGYQVADSSGKVAFTTIYPGWYQGRATHIHFKVRKDNMEFTSQWFFDDSLSDEVDNNESPYNQKGASGRMSNERDGIFQQSDGMLMLDVQRVSDGYQATFTIGIQM